MISKKKENRLLFYILSFSWGLAYTLVGLLVFLFIIVFMWRRVIVSTEQGRIRVHFIDTSFGGASLGIVIITSGNQFDQRLVRHELGHTIQNARFGVLFPFLIAIPSGIRYQLWDKIKKKYPNKKYDDIWFERQATELGDIYFKK